MIGAQHCSSLCSQSEGHGYVANLPEPYFGQCGASAPEGGTYSRVGASPYLLGPIYEPRPCKGLISRILLRGKPRQRYAPLTGAAARIGEHWREIGASPYPGICAPFRGNPHAQAARQFVNSCNSLLRRLRPLLYFVVFRPNHAPRNSSIRYHPRPNIRQTVAASSANCRFSASSDGKRCSSRTRWRKRRVSVSP